MKNLYPGDYRTANSIDSHTTPSIIELDHRPTTCGLFVGWGRRKDGNGNHSG